MAPLAHVYAILIGHFVAAVKGDVRDAAVRAAVFDRDGPGLGLFHHKPVDREVLHVAQQHADRGPAALVPRRIEMGFGAAAQDRVADAQNADVAIACHRLLSRARVADQVVLRAGRELNPAIAQHQGEVGRHQDCALDQPKRLAAPRVQAGDLDRPLAALDRPRDRRLDAVAVRPRLKGIRRYGGLRASPCRQHDYKCSDRDLHLCSSRS